MPISVPYIIEVLVLANGISPFDQWFQQLDELDQYMVETRLHRVRQGVFGEINSVGRGIWELKFRKGRALRIYYTLKDRRVVLLIIGGDKRSQKNDISKAKALCKTLQE